MKLEIYRRGDGLFAWRLKAVNGRVIATDGGQGYARKGACIRAADASTGRRFRADVTLVDLTHLT